MSRSIVATLSFSFAATLAHLVGGRQCIHRSMDGDDWWTFVLFVISQSNLRTSKRANMFLRPRQPIPVHSPTRRSSLTMKKEMVDANASASSMSPRLHSTPSTTDSLATHRTTHAPPNSLSLSLAEQDQLPSLFPPHTPSEKDEAEHTQAIPD
ncbi:hypothetical protein BLNAU_11985 [Blattamonas nauphoetae]|uniref:Secreted protein n=1 Tax=Blattamonas nauphoetae TaxID=2049346 RepID=A0ABQ9XLS4_9EUKA|nr:hypothetical protein BLNAU_11985 [Blattamonas nauphoetae]